MSQIIISDMQKQSTPFSLSSIEGNENGLVSIAIDRAINSRKILGGSERLFLCGGRPIE
jgi:hypothetical protein